CARGSQGFDFW
nr:immunoglobulin heavy chain junction region [Macaca mulatta]